MQDTFQVEWSSEFKKKKHIFVFLMQDTFQVDFVTDDTASPAVDNSGV